MGPAFTGEEIEAGEEQEEEEEEDDEEEGPIENVFDAATSGKCFSHYLTIVLLLASHLSCGGKSPTLCAACAEKAVLHM